MACQKALGTRNANSCSLARAENSPLNNQGNSERPSGRLNDFSLLRLPRGKFSIYLNKGLARGKTEQASQKNCTQCPEPHACNGLRQFTAICGDFKHFEGAATDDDRIATPLANHTSAQRQQTPVVEYKGSVRRGVVFSRQGFARSVAYTVAQNRARVGQMFDALVSCLRYTGACALQRRRSS